MQYINFWVVNYNFDWLVSFAWAITVPVVRVDIVKVKIVKVNNLFLVSIKTLINIDL